MKKSFVFVLMVCVLASAFVGLSKADTNAPQRFTNLLVNPNFDQGLTGWTTLTTLNATIDVVSNASTVWNNSLRITRSQYGYGYARQTIDMGNVTAKYLLAVAWAKSLNATEDYVFFDFFVTINYNDGATATFDKQFSHGTHDWEVKSMQISAGDKPINFIDFFVRFQDNSGTVWFDGLYLAWVDSYVQVKCTDKTFRNLSGALVKVYANQIFLDEKSADENGTADFVLPLYTNPSTFKFVVYWGGQLMANQDISVTKDGEFLISSDVAAEVVNVNVALRDIFNQPLANTAVKIRYRPLASAEQFSSLQFLTDANGNINAQVLTGSGEIAASLDYNGNTYEARNIVVTSLNNNLEMQFNFIKLGSWIVPTDLLILYVIAAIFLVVGAIVVSHSFYVRRKTSKATPASGTQSGEKQVSAGLRIAEVAYLFMVTLSFYLLFVSRPIELYTVWEVLNPLFMPLFFASVILLLVIIMSQEKVEYKLMFVIFNAILSHSFYYMVYPASTVAGDAANILGIDRRVFDNISLHGAYGVTPDNLPLTLYLWFRGDSFHPAVATIFARMFGIDVYWMQAFLLPVLWGIFMPLLSFKLTSKLNQGQNVSIVASLIVSAFPAAIVWGAVFVPNSLGFLFFLCAILFSVYYISSGGNKLLLLAVAFSTVSFLAHFLTGVMSFSFLFLALALRSYEQRKTGSIVIRQGLILLAVIFSASLLLLALVSQRLVYPIVTYFSLDKLGGMSVTDAIWSALLGEFVNADIRTAMFNLLIPLIGLIGMVYVLGKSRGHSRIYSVFLFLVFLIVSVDYVIMRLFMVGVPFGEGRILLLRDLVATPFVAIVAAKVFSFLREVTTGNGGLSKPTFKAKVNPKFLTVFLMIVLVGSGWVIASIYYAYPQYRLLQTTSYELEAARFIDMTTNGSYVVISDEWFIYAGEAVVGIYNPHAYYFANFDSQLIALYNQMLTNPSPGPLIEAMETPHSAMGTTYTGATIAYFVIEQSRMSASDFNRVYQQAYLTLKVYGIFGDGKLYVFYYQRPSQT